MARVRIDQAAINRFGSLPQVERDMDRRAQRVATTARSDAPVRTGEYRASIRVEDLGGGARRIIAEADHAIFVEEDTRPHTIRPRFRRALYWAGADHPVAVVHHPGTRGQHVMARALNAAYGLTHA
ncbi:HK97 gp10 family phage protein [Allonocardiopsis opalescens]|uniref:Bacteriophage HK97-gp10 putative tail-component n=1 Tax=Allonocardiopsis opalescens TaxID=1144618 RepID=A0A2T0PSW0_9ACTN|nr:HK97 gp10 family phage protein [Allonocardiopsis opalescens]PRX91983.1 bacteriophage HK97-gp10 putative tail-component [Allonocardiopsis opalescens]